jgi:RNA-directed DNA polymerase
VCGQLLLYAEVPPQTPEEWEQWARATGKALAKRSLYQERKESDGRSSVRLLHARCQPRRRASATTDLGADGLA